MKEKKKLTQQQEFDVMKLVLDKFLWIGTLIMLYSLYVVAVQGWQNWSEALAIFISGAVILVIFMWIIIKEYEIVK
jgi:ABC-type transport system involved in cytochrome bd biosynthesis fused ATPase/permease subunit